MPWPMMSGYTERPTASTPIDMRHSQTVVEANHSQLGTLGSVDGTWCEIACLVLLASQSGHCSPVRPRSSHLTRRICIGRFLADNSVWIMVATMLATLEFHKKIDRDGNIIEPRVIFTNGGTWYVTLPHTSLLPWNSWASPVLTSYLKNFSLTDHQAIQSTLSVKSGPGPPRPRRSLEPVTIETGIHSNGEADFRFQQGGP